MPLIKLPFKPGVNRENTRYTTEGGWYTSDKVRFRQGTPEKIGGWARISANTFIGICRSLWSWATLGGRKLAGVMTERRRYIEYNGTYNNISPVLDVNYWPTPNVISATVGSSIIKLGFNPLVSNSGDWNWVGSYVYLTETNGLDANITEAVLNNKFFTILSYDSILDEITIDVGVAAAANVTVPVSIGGKMNNGGPLTSNYYSQANFGQDLLFCQRGGQICVWRGLSGWLLNGNTITFSVISGDTVVTTTQECTRGTGDRFPVFLRSTGHLPGGFNATTMYWLGRYGSSGAVTQFAVYTDSVGGSPVSMTSPGSGTFTAETYAVPLKQLSGVLDIPDKVNIVFVSDIYRFVFALGCNDIGTTDSVWVSQLQPMLIRWSDQESYLDWTPSATNQAGSLILSRGSEIIAAQQARQEVLVWTDSALYALQYQGPPTVWGAQLVGDNISITSQNAMAFAANQTFWMGVDKFYVYSGTVETLKCDLRQYIYGDINTSQFSQIFAGTNEGFNEIWWFYCSANSSTIDRYVIYNYSEKIWYYGSMARTAWVDSGIRNFPLAATYANNLVNHESGVDDNITGTPVAIAASIESAEVDLEDGDKFMFVKRVLPDVTFRGSTAMNPSGILTLKPLANSGSGYLTPASLGGTSSNADATVTRTATVPVEAFTGQVYIRLRGRQIAVKFESIALGVQWQLGSMRLDAKPDGMASGYGVNGGP